MTLSDKAHAQLEGAYEWWAENRSLEQAARWYNALADAVLTLAENPQRCPRSAESGVFL